MNIETFLTECLIRGYRISLEGDSLRVTGDPKPATLDFIREHKGEIIQALTDQQHGACIHCGCDTDAMLTVPGTGCMWCCPACFERRTGEAQGMAA